MPFVGLHHVQVAAPPGAEPEARRFYGSLLGLEEIERPAPMADRGGVWFRCGPQTLHVGIATDFTPATKAHPALELDDVGELRRLAACLVEAGVDVHWREDLPGYERFHAEDPWGNRLELLAAS